MDRKSILILALCFVAFFTWHLLVDRIYPPKRVPLHPTNAVPAEVVSTNGNPAPVTPPTLMPESTPARAQLVTNTSVPEELVEVTNSSAHYTFTSYGGGLKE